MTDRDERKIVVADSDEGLRKSICSRVSARGFDAIPVEDGSKALEITLTRRPDLLILDGDLKVLPTVKLVQIIRSNPRTKEIPIIYMSREEKSISTYRPDIDDFVRKPFNVSEFILRVSRIAKHGRSGSPFISGDTEVSGKLSQMSLPDILQMFSMNKRSGVLHVKSKKVTGSVYLLRGEIVSAISGPTAGEKAFYRLIALPDGDFQFVPGIPETRRTIDRSINNLILEGVRRLDEMNKSREDFPDPEESVELICSASELPIKSNPVAKELVMLADFYNKVGDMINASSFPDYDVYKTLSSLKERGFIRVGSFDREEADLQFLTREEVITLRSTVESVQGERRSRGSIIGRVAFFVPEDSILNDLIGALNSFPEFEVDRFFFSMKSRNNGPLIGIFGYLNFGENARVALISFRSRREFSPLWYAVGGKVMGIIIMLKDEMSSSIDDLSAVTEYARTSGSGSILGVMSRNFSNFGLGDNFLALFQQRASKLGCSIRIKEMESITSPEIQSAVQEILKKHIESRETRDDRSSYPFDIQ